MEFKKFDGGKNRPDLIPVEFIAGVGAVLQLGAEKYGENNWTAGTNWSRVVGALMRHLTLWLAGEDTDPESGLNHMFHVGCNAAFLTAFQSRGLGTDDRQGRLFDTAAESVRSINEAGRQGAISLRETKEKNTASSSLISSLPRRPIRCISCEAEIAENF